MSNFNRLYAILNSHSGGTENKKCVLIFLSKNLSRFLNVRESSSHVRQRGFARACLTPDRQKRGGEHLVRREHFKKKNKRIIGKTKGMLITFSSPKNHSQVSPSHCGAT